MKNHKNFWTVPKVSPFYAQHCPLNSFGHNFNRFCGISVQNLKSRFFAVFWSSNFTGHICKSSKKITYDPHIWPKTTSYISYKSHKISESYQMPFKNENFFFGLGGSIWPPPSPSWIGLKHPERTPNVTRACSEYSLNAMWIYS